MNTKPLIVLAALAALLFAGCGESSDSTDAAAKSQAPPASKAPVATGDAEHGGHAAPGKKQVATKPRSKQARQESRDRKSPESPSADGKEKESPKTVDQKVEAIIKGAGGETKGKRVSSPKEIRKVLHELKGDPDDGGAASGPDSIEKALEGVLGGP